MGIGMSQQVGLQLGARREGIGHSSGAAVERVRALAAEEINRLRGELSAEAQDLRRVVEDQSQQVLCWCFEDVDFLLCCALFMVCAWTCAG